MTDYAVDIEHNMPESFGYRPVFDLEELSAPCGFLMRDIELRHLTEQSTDMYWFILYTLLRRLGYGPRHRVTVRFRPKCIEWKGILISTSSVTDDVALFYKGKRYRSEALLLKHFKGDHRS
jgi:hypothetical protein